MALKRMDNVGIVVDDLGGTIGFFQELGLVFPSYACGTTERQTTRRRKLPD
jgi:hypothetical protein